MEGAITQLTLIDANNFYDPIKLSTLFSHTYTPIYTYVCKYILSICLHILTICIVHCKLNSAILIALADLTSKELQFIAPVLAH